MFTMNASGPQGPLDLETIGDAPHVEYHPADAPSWPGAVDPGNVNSALDALLANFATVLGAGTDQALIRRNGTGANVEDVPGVIGDDSGNLLLALAQEIRFRAAANKIYSRIANYLSLVSDPAGYVEIGQDGDAIDPGNATLRYRYPFADGMCRLGLSGANRYDALALKPRAGLTGDGDIWYDSTQKAMQVFVDGIEQTLVGVIFTQTADKSVTNTTTETTIIGTGVGGLALPANFWVAGKTIRIRIGGVYSTVAATGDIVTIRVKLDAVVIALKATSALLTGATNLSWWGQVDITCRSTGATGTVQARGSVRYQITAVGGVAEDELDDPTGAAGTATATIDTTQGDTLDVTVQHSAANASNTVKSICATVEVLN